MVLDVMMLLLLLLLVLVVMEVMRWQEHVVVVVHIAHHWCLWLWLCVHHLLGWLRRCSVVSLVGCIVGDVRRRRWWWRWSGRCDSTVEIASVAVVVVISGRAERHKVTVRTCRRRIAHAVVADRGNCGCGCRGRHNCRIAVVVVVVVGVGR